MVNGRRTRWEKVIESPSMIGHNHFKDILKIAKHARFSPSRRFMSRVSDNTQEWVYGALLRLELNGRRLQFAGANKHQSSLKSFLPWNLKLPTGDRSLLTEVF
jgi:hypothetical protein